MIVRPRFDGAPAGVAAGISLFRETSRPTTKKEIDPWERHGNPPVSRHRGAPGRPLANFVVKPCFSEQTRTTGIILAVSDRKPADTPGPSRLTLSPSRPFGRDRVRIGRGMLGAADSMG
jgi:hypothetical protein